MTESAPHPCNTSDWGEESATLLGQVLDNIRKVSSYQVSHYTWSIYCNLATVGQAYNLLWRILPHNTKQRNTYSGVFIALTVTYPEGYYKVQLLEEPRLLLDERR